MAIRNDHPAKTLAAGLLADDVRDVLTDAKRLQADYPHVADYRLTTAIGLLTSAARLLKELANGVTPELDAQRAIIASNPDHPLNPNYAPTTKFLLAARDAGRAIVDPTGRRVLYQPREDHDALPWVVVCGTYRYAASDLDALETTVDVLTDATETA